MNRLNLIKTAFLFVIAICFIACGKKGASSDPGPNGTSSSVPDTAKYITWPANADIYLVGTISNIQTGPIATLWKNGVATNLVNPLESLNRSTPKDVAISGTDVYVVGEAAIGSYVYAVYWKNGIMTRLQNSVAQSTANAIFISGSDIYIAGSNDGKATLWKNGIATSITTPSTVAAEATSIYISGSDVYVAGNTYTQVAPYMNAALWKNGQSVNLDGIGGLNESHTRNVYVKGNDVYVVGNIPFKGAALWKNGSLTILAQTGNGAPDANNIGFNGNDMYITGYVNGKATVWKNSTTQTLPYDSNESIQPSLPIGFNNNDVYVAAGNETGTSPNTLLWVNGLGYKFTNKPAQVTGMAIVTH